jgi:uncharacterized RDD family membrane protein YckC
MILHEVISTEKVPFTYRVAGVGSRFLAWLIDAALILLLILIGCCGSVTLDVGREGLGRAVFLLWLFGLVWGYFTLFEWLWGGQTPGKRILGIRVVQWQGTGVSFYQSAVRNILRVVDGLPLPFLLYGLGLVVAACNREGRRLGDLAAGTLVVHVERKAPPIRALADGAGPGRVADPAVRQRLAQLDRPQKQLLLDLCLRREQLGAADRARLFRTAAEYLQARFGLVADEYQSDEKFVLQVGAVLGAESNRP